MESLNKLTCKIMIEHKIKELEEETMLGLYNIILDMHKHLVKDYMDVINNKCKNDEEIDELEIDKIFKQIFLICLKLLIVIFNTE